jgi:hypothetical protein
VSGLRASCATASLSVLGFRPEARLNPGLAASCLTSIRYSVRYVLQGRYQGLSLFDAAFDLTWPTCLGSENGHLPGTMRSPVQIIPLSLLSDADVPIEQISRLVGHSSTTTTETIYRKQIRLVIVHGADVMDRIFPGGPAADA